MSLLLDGTNGLSDVDGTAATPAIRGTDANTGIFFPAADTIGFSEGGAEVMRIDSSGNVGILNTVASTIDAVNGGGTLTVGAGGAANEGVTIYTNASQSGILNFADGTVGAQTYAGYIAYNHTANRMEFGTNAGEKMQIDSSGNLLVGTTSAGVANTLSTTIETSGANNSRITVNHSSIAGSGNDSNYMQFGYAGNLIGRIVQATTSSVSYTTSSDYRLKENVAPMTGALAKVAALKPCTYTWKSNGEAGQGFIAHELQAVVPDCVTGAKDAVETVDDLDSEGRKIGTKEVPRYQGVDTSFLVATLVAAIQELKSEFDAYKATHP
jgi:hypothetical protein